MFYYIQNNKLNETSATFAISGPDANTYLQGQLTQDLNGPVGSAAYGLWLTQKGKVLADSTMLRRGANEFRVVSFSASAAVLRERIESYLISDDVTVRDETAQWDRIALWGEGAAAALSALLGSALAAGKFIEAKNGIAFGGRLAAGSFELLIPTGTGDATAQQFNAAGGQRVETAAADRARILAGIPAIPVDIGANDLPNEGGLDDVAISYTKGCYLGQEVMARLKNLGQVRRRLHVVRGAGTTPVASTALYQGDKKVGDIRSAASEGDGFVAMAMLSLVNLDAAKLLSLSAGGAAEIQVVRRV